MGKLYTDIDELEKDYTIYKARKIYSLIKNSFQMEKALAIYEGEIEEEALEQAEQEFNEKLETDLAGLESAQQMEAEEEKEMLAELFEFMINIEVALDPTPDYHTENFEVERDISRNIADFYFEATLDFLYIQGNTIAEHLKWEAQELFTTLHLFTSDNFFREV